MSKKSGSVSCFAIFYYTAFFPEKLPAGRISRRIVLLHKGAGKPAFGFPAPVKTGAQYFRSKQRYVPALSAIAAHKWPKAV